MYITDHQFQLTPLLPHESQEQQFDLAISILGLFSSLGKSAHNNTQASVRYHISSKTQSHKDAKHQYLK